MQRWMHTCWIRALASQNRNIVWRYYWTDSLEEAEAYAKETFLKKKDAEKEMYDKIQEERRAKEEEEMGDFDMDDMDMDGMMDEF